MASNLGLNPHPSELQLYLFQQHKAAGTTPGNPKLASNLGLNPHPSELQLYLFQQHKAAGTTPGNPKWYRQSNPPARAPFAWRPGMKPVYPKIETGSDFHRRDNPHRADHPIEVARRNKTDIKAYVEAYDRASGFINAYGDRFNK